MDRWLWVIINDVYVYYNDYDGEGSKDGDDGVVMMVDLPILNMMYFLN